MAFSTLPTSLSTPSPPLFSAAQTSSASSSSSSTATNEALFNNAALRTQNAAAVAISPPDNSDRTTGNSQGKKRRNFSVEESEAQQIVTTFSKRKKDLESEKEGNAQSLESYRKRQQGVAEEITNLQQRIVSLQQERANLDHYIISLDYRLGQIQEEEASVELVLDVLSNPDKYPVVPTPSKRSRTAAFSTPEGRLSAEEIRLLAMFYSSTDHVYYHRDQKVKVTGSNEQKFTVASIDSPSEPFEASDEELTFFPEKGSYLIRWTKVPKAWAGKYFAAEVLSAKIKPDCISCKIVWTELKETEEEEEGPRYLRNLSDILPFGSDHPNAKLLQKDTSERQGILRERYFLKKIELTPENFLN